MDKGSVGNEDAHHIMDSKVLNDGLYHSELMGFCAVQKPSTPKCYTVSSEAFRTSMDLFVRKRLILPNCT